MVKVCLIGGAGVGKTSICQAFKFGKCEINPFPTIGADYNIRQNVYLLFEMV